MQVLMSFLRFLVIIVMISTSVGDIAAHKNHESDESSDPHMYEAVRIENIGLASPIIALAIVFQAS